MATLLCAQDWPPSLFMVMQVLCFYVVGFGFYKHPTMLKKKTLKTKTVTSKNTITFKTNASLIGFLGC
jgi:hypothetical protein